MVRTKPAARDSLCVGFVKALAMREINPKAPASNKESSVFSLAIEATKVVPLVEVSTAFTAPVDQNSESLESILVPEM